MPQDPLHLLCIEPSFPGRLGAVADWLVRRRGYRCQFFFANAETPEHWPESVGKGLELVHFNAGVVDARAGARSVLRLRMLGSAGDAAAAAG
jgi:hypothetical protein